VILRPSPVAGLALGLALGTALVAGATLASVAVAGPVERDPPAALLRPTVPDLDGSSAGASCAFREDRPYDGTFEFVRVQFTGPGFGGFQGPEWAHDYPRADRNFIQVLSEVTNMEPRPDGCRVLRMDDPEIFDYPLIYLVEIGYWRPDEAELEALRAYIAKGGFLIVDDFRQGQIENLIRIMSIVAPEYQVREIPDDHPVWDAFFRIEDPGALIPLYGPRAPTYLGIFEDDDPNGRLLSVFNYNNDIAEYWEYSDQGYYPIDLSNEAYKFGVNYVVYAHTR
jgi:hypothetical protein